MDFSSKLGLEFTFTVTSYNRQDISGFCLPNTRASAPSFDKSTAVKFQFARLIPLIQFLWDCHLKYSGIPQLMVEYMMTTRLLNPYHLGIESGVTKKCKRSEILYLKSRVLRRLIINSDHLTVCVVVDFHLQWRNISSFLLFL